MSHAPGLRGRARGRARGRGRGVPGARGAGQRRARPTPVGHFRPAATLDEGYVDNLETIFAEFYSALEQGHRDRDMMAWGSDPRVAGGKQVELIKVRRSAAGMLTPQPRLHVADAPWYLTRSRDLPTRKLGDDLTVFVFAGDVENEVQGPGANQQRDAEEERRRRWNLVSRAEAVDRAGA